MCVLVGPRWSGGMYGRENRRSTLRPCIVEASCPFEEGERSKATEETPTCTHEGAPASCVEFSFCVGNESLAFPMPVPVRRYARLRVKLNARRV